MTHVTYIRILVKWKKCLEFKIEHIVFKATVSEIHVLRFCYHGFIIKVSQFFTFVCVFFTIFVNVSDLKGR
jgi:hypothetical protein